MVGKVHVTILLSVIMLLHQLCKIFVNQYYLISTSTGCNATPSIPSELTFGNTFLIYCIKFISYLLFRVIHITHHTTNYDGSLKTRTLIKP